MATEILSSEFTIQVSGKTIARASDFTLNSNNNMVDITSFDSAGWKEVLPGGGKDWTVDANGTIVRSGTTTSGLTSYDTLYTAWLNGTLLAIAIKPTGTDKYVSGSGYITKITSSYKVNDKATYAISFQGSGSLIFN
jgi:predicted secreted protein